MSQTTKKNDFTHDKDAKSYSKLHSSFFSHFTVKSLKTEKQTSKKKIIPTTAQSGLREEFKKTFLPLLIDVFELRQMIETYKMQKKSPELECIGKVSKTPQEILNNLKQLQQDIEESQRWCSGVILQISKGIEEAKEALEMIQKEDEGVSHNKVHKNHVSPFKSFINKVKDKLWQ
ncbi:MAG: hypothetical protein S4CHLAM37_09530 [Chlamydiia bacterium]|nr:hypothetical protein [Chlamydiia bacterium]